MRKFLLGLFGTLALSGIISCKEDFDVAAPYKDITIVYSMLYVNDNTHYIRIQKAFMDQDKSAVDMAKVSDSSFYPEEILEVHMKELSGNNIISDNILQRVNMLDEGITKEPGAFFTSPNYAYKYSKVLNPAYEYRLVIINKSTGDVDSGQTKIITNDTSSNGFFVKDFWLDGGSNGPVPPVGLDFARAVALGDKYELKVNIPPPAKYLEGVIRFFYWEKNNNVGSVEKKSLDFPFAQTTVENNLGTLQAPNSDFYYFFRDKLGTAPANVARYLDSICEIYVYAASEDFLTYKNQAQAQGSGITINEIKPIYTNLKGSNIYGLFTTRGLRIGHTIIITGRTFDALYENSITRETGLQPEPYRGQ